MSVDAARLAALDAELAGFPPTSVTARLCGALYAQLPNAPALPPYASFDAAAQSLHQDWKPETLARARELASAKPVADVRNAARAIDTGDTGLTIVTGLRSALSLFWGDKAQVADEAQQKADAALKALGIAFIAGRLFEGTVKERLAQLRRVPAGRSLLLYYGMAEVALPFVTDVVAAEGSFVRDLVATQATSIASKLGTIVGKDGVDNAVKVLDELVETLDGIALKTVQYVEPVATSVQAYLPGPIKAAGGELTDLAAIGADMLPVYRYLVNRLAAESALFRAIQELEPERLPQPAAPDAASADEAPTEGGTGVDAAGLHGLRTAEVMAETWRDALALEPEAAAPPRKRSPFAGLAAVSAGPSVDLEPVGGDDDRTATMPATDTVVSPVRSPSPPPLPVGLSQTLVPEDFGDSEHLPDEPEPVQDGVLGDFDEIPERTDEASTMVVQMAPPTPAPIPGLDAMEAMPTFTPEMLEDIDLSSVGEAPIDGVWLHREPDGPARWVVLSASGVFSNRPPVTPPPVDWEAHRDAGHLVGTWRRMGDLLLIEIAGTPQEAQLQVGEGELTVDGVTLRKADHDLTGKVLSGRWRPRDGSGRRWRFDEAGAVFTDESGADPAGRYELGYASLTVHWADGTRTVLSMFSDLQPPGQTDFIALDGEIYDREDA